MPCRLEASDLEIKGSRVLTFLEEMKTGTLPDKSHLEGYHPRAYCPSLRPEILDEKTAELCELCQQRDTTKLSLELQIWWRDHQAGEERRASEDAESLKQKNLRQMGQSSLEKLTLEEQKALKLFWLGKENCNVSSIKKRE